MVATPKVPYGFEKQRKGFTEVSEGVYPRLTTEPAPYLPIKSYVNRAECGIVLPAGSLVALDAWNNLVPANGGVAISTFPYSALDKATVYQYNGSNDEGVGSLVSTGSETFTFAANNVIGYVPYDVYQNQRYLRQIYQNYQVQNDKIAVGCDWYVEYPCITDAQLCAKTGDLVVPDPDHPGYWMPLNDTAIALLTGGYQYVLAADNSPSMAEILRVQKNVFGKVYRVDVVEDIDNLSRHITVPGLGLAGSETSGIPQHLGGAVADANNRQGGGTSAKYKVQIQVLL